MSFLLGIVFVSIGYIVGARVGKLASDEVASGGKYFVLVREACILATTALVAFTQGITWHYVFPIILLLLMIFWREHERIYPWLFALLLFFSNEFLIVATALLFIAAFTTAAYHYKRLLDTSAFAAYWPLPLTGLVLWFIRFFS